MTGRQHRATDAGPTVDCVVCGAAVAGSLLVSLFGYWLLPSRVRIHWSLGMGAYYGPEFAPTLLVLVVFPALVTVGALAGRWGLHRVGTDHEGDSSRRYAALAIAAGLAILVAIQLGLIAANL